MYDEPSSDHETAGRAVDAAGNDGPGHPANLLAWLVIILICASIALLVQGAAEEDAEAPDEPGAALVMTELVARYGVGAARFVDSEGVYEGIKPQLNLGSVAQRQRFVIFAADLAGPAEARDVLEQLDELIGDVRAGREEGDPPVMRESEERVHELLHRLYASEVDADGEPVIALDALSETERQFLRDELGWFGKLALTPENLVSREERRELMRSAQRVTFGVIGGISALILIGLAGVVLLVIVVIGFGKQNLQWRYRPGSGVTSVYAETFALWLLLHFGLQFLVQLIVAQTGADAYAFALSIMAFFAGLTALFWPIIRGVPWRVVREDTGLTLGRRPTLEPLIGVAGYAMGLPILVAGLICTMLLMMLAGLLAEPPSPLSPGASPAHPVALQIGEADVWVKLQIFIVAAVAAPIVEEIMFRGVLYRNLRQSSRRFGREMSIVLSVLVSAFVFAIVHPQGWMGVPALMSLSIVFALVREWRDTVIPAIVIHAISNAIVVGGLIYLFS